MRQRHKQLKGAIDLQELATSDEFSKLRAKARAIAAQLHIQVRRSISQGSLSLSSTKDALELCFDWGEIVWHQVVWSHQGLCYSYELEVLHKEVYPFMRLSLSVHHDADHLKRAEHFFVHESDIASVFDIALFDRYVDFEAMDHKLALALAKLGGSLRLRTPHMHD